MIHTDTFEEAAQYIRQQAVRHKAAEEAFVYETIELNVFRAILAVALKEGLSLDPVQTHNVVNGVDDDDEFTTWHYMHELLETVHALWEQDNLPPQTTKLFSLWQQEFWGASEAAD